MTPEIKTEIPSLLLRLLREEDTEELYLWVDQNREHLRWRASWVDGTTAKSDTQKFVRFCLDSAVSGTGFHYALLLDGEIVGLVTFNNIDKMNRCATMGYWLAKSQTGRGLMTTAAKTLIDEGYSITPALLLAHLRPNRPRPSSSSWSSIAEATEPSI